MNKTITFLNWLNLNLDAITWEGRNKDEFLLVWESIFCSENPFKEINKLISRLPDTPLKSWFKWLRDMNVCYYFFVKNYSFDELRLKSNLEVNEIAMTLRVYFLKHYPMKIEAANEFFRSGNQLTRNSEVRFADLDGSLNRLKLDYTYSDVMKEVEATLMDGWKDILDSVSDKNEVVPKKEPLNFINIRFIREVFLLAAIGILILITIRFGNKIYEDNLIKKVSMMESNFLWLDKELSFNRTSTTGETIDLNSKELENLERVESESVRNQKVAESAFLGESDVELTSVNALPKDFSKAGLELSKYEELKVSGYRDRSYGRGRAYRILINSIDVKKTKKLIGSIITKYKLEQADNVVPGTEVPGGAYYNMFAPSNQLKSFISNMDKSLSMTLYESRTVFSAPDGMNKIFIWVKLI